MGKHSGTVSTASLSLSGDTNSLSMGGSMRSITNNSNVYDENDVDDDDAASVLSFGPEYTNSFTARSSTASAMTVRAAAIITPGSARSSVFMSQTLHCSQITLPTYAMPSRDEIIDVDKDASVTSRRSSFAMVDDEFEEDDVA